MTSQSVDGHYGRTVALDLCHPCGAFWFDVNESLALTPGAVLRLFVVIGERRDDRRPPSESPTCPRCRHRLARTFDMQRATRFAYWRCPAEHGRFITFGEFLREKNFVRPLSAAELADLRANVTMIHCSSCGAPIDLERTSTCDYYDCVRKVREFTGYAASLDACPPSSMRAPTVSPPTSTNWPGSWGIGIVMSRCAPT